MLVTTEAELAGITRAGHVVRETLHELRALARPGLTTRDLDRACDRLLASFGARPAPMLKLGFPGSLCVSVNDEVVHGVPSLRVLQPGDLVKLDVTAELDGYIADAAVTVPLPPVLPLHRRLCEVTEQALHTALADIRAGEPLHRVGSLVEGVVRRQGFTVLAGLAGHGVGRDIHEAPHNVSNRYDPELTEILADGLVIAIEPLVGTGSPEVAVGLDGWTLRTVDGSPTAHFEHTVLLRPDGVVVLT